MLSRLAARLKKNAAQLIAVVLVVGVFGFVLPRVADYGEVWSVVKELSTRDMALLSGAAILNVVTFAPPWMAALPGLSFGHAMVMSQASTAASSVMPGGDAIGMALSYSMLRRWGFRVEQVAVATAATAVWNTIANVGFAVVAVVLLALGGQSHALLTTTAAIGGVVLVVGLVAFVLALQDERNARRVGALAERLANRVLAVLRRSPVMGWADRLVLFRREAIGLLGRRWHVLTLATLAGHLAMFLVLVQRYAQSASHPTSSTHRGLRILVADPHRHDDPDHPGRARDRRARPHGRARLVRSRPGRGGRSGAALPGADVHPAGRARRRVPAVLATCRAECAGRLLKSSRVVRTTPDCVGRTIVGRPVGCERTPGWYVSAGVTEVGQ